MISPILANLFLHYTFDLWMKRTYPDLLWCRYADDGLVHCRTEQEAEALKADLQARLAECHLELHPDKTRIVYCKDGKRNAEYPNVTFDFLGYCFRPRLVKNTRNRQLFCGFNPAVSPAALKDHTVDDQGLEHSPTNATSLEEIARRLNPLLRGWIEYYGTLHAFGVGAHAPARQFDAAGLGRDGNSSALRRIAQAGRFLEQLARKQATSSYTGVSQRTAGLPDGSRVRRELHARF